MPEYPLGCAHQDCQWHAVGMSHNHDPLWSNGTSFEPGAWFAQDMPATAPAIIGHQLVGLPAISARETGP